MALRVKNADPVALGVRWEDYDKDVSFKIAGLDNEEYQLGMERARRLIAKADQGQTLKNLSISTEDQREFQTQCKLVGTFILKDWKGEIYDEQDKLMAYSPENAEKLLLGNVTLFVWVIGKAQVISADKKTEETETVGKPSPDSSGN